MVMPSGGVINFGTVVITDEPVPNVIFPSPVLNAPWPKRALCESPIADAIGIPSGITIAFCVSPKIYDESRTTGSMHSSIPKIAQSLRSHTPSTRLNN